MRKITLFTTILLSSLIIFSACGQNNRQHSYNNEYHDCYEDGFADGYEDGIAYAQQHLSSAIESDIDDICWEIEDNFGIYPEDAAQILVNYIDNSAEATEEEVQNAVMALYRYYFNSQTIINQIDSYDID